MNVARPVRLADDGQTPGAEVEGEIRGLVRREVANYRRQPEPHGEMILNEAHSVLQRVSVTSVHEIDKLIAELQSLREFLQTESQRIQREIAEYAHLADAAVKSTKMIAENMVPHKNAPEHSR
jgi:hypothetical protein